MSAGKSAVATEGPRCYPGRRFSRVVTPRFQRSSDPETEPREKTHGSTCAEPDRRRRSDPIAGHVTVIELIGTSTTHLRRGHGVRGEDDSPVWPASEHGSARPVRGPAGLLGHIRTRRRRPVVQHHITPKDVCRGHTGRLQDLPAAQMQTVAVPVHPDRVTVHRAPRRAPKCGMTKHTRPSAVLARFGCERLGAAYEVCRDA